MFLALHLPGNFGLGTPGGIIVVSPFEDSEYRRYVIEAENRRIVFEPEDRRIVTSSR